ncbi:LysR substrate-binding domain-containing protein [Neoroseomonas soli]|uniref:LysR family transcriptional regulator n=1 Tax=Neoroseomonas soli TaxID=1081025 RepID=A0A9X9WZM5_9PROT|nr:LysR substrate-binding domain-containing protein [Neoroseomonas soli]MBR0672604.1 LysR family transcriptional regulator [Neoroseomonas soli]
MNLRDLRYMLAVAEHRHFGKAAAACQVSQPTLSIQLRKLEEELGTVLFERSSRQVVPTPMCETLLGHARAAVAEADAIAALARSAMDPLRGPMRLGIIPTLGPYLLPLVLAPLRAALPGLEIEPWEDVTATLLERLRAHALDAALIATEPEGNDLVAMPLFTEPFLAALPPEHPLAAQESVIEADLAPDVLVLADGHCLRDQALAACGLAGPSGGALRAASLATLINMVAAGYGTTLIPGLAAGAAQDAGIVLRPLRQRASRTIRMTWRAAFPRREAVEAVARVVAERLAPFAAAAERDAAALDHASARAHLAQSA